MSAQGIQIEYKYMNTIKNYFELEFVQGIHICLIFSNFYKHFI